ncbi:MAG: hypothetical protein ACXAEX_21110 [Promethearchaeota archaeon]|jgi:uncharacterized membrane protein YuzA (DUF378 family)
MKRSVFTLITFILVIMILGNLNAELLGFNIIDENDFTLTENE